MKGILFVCTGNICRSAMAHHYLQKRLYDLKKENDIFVSSCGTSAQNGERSTESAIQVMKKYDVDLVTHKATNMFDIDVTNYDLVLCMTEAHKYNFLTFFPKMDGKVFTLKEYVYGEDKDNIDISDPWGYGIKIYDDCAKEIVDCVDKLLEKI